MTQKSWYDLKDTDPEKYAEIKAKTDARRKAAHEKIYNDPVARAKWYNNIKEGVKKRTANKKAKKIQKQLEIDEQWKEVEDWIKEIEKNLLPRKNALRKLTKFLIAWTRRWKHNKRQREFHKANPNYGQDWIKKNGGAAEVRRKTAAKKANKQAAIKHLEITEMTEDERRLFKYNNMLDNHTERCNTKAWLKRRNLPLERTPFLQAESKPEPKKVPLAEKGQHSAAFKKWEAILTKPERQMTLEEMGQAAGGPINWVPDIHQKVDIPTSEWDD